MDTKDIKIFRQVYETSSFSKAAQEVYMTPQGVSKIIQKLESELGFTLFNRTSKGVKPTRYAEQLYRKSSTIMDLFHSMYSDIEINTAHARISVAFSYGVLAYFRFNLIEQFHKSNPSIHLDYMEDTDSKIEAWNKKGRTSSLWKYPALIVAILFYFIKLNFVIGYHPLAFIPHNIYRLVY